MSAERERWAQMCEEQARYQYRRTETRDAWLAIAAALRSSEPQGWQPIETAPKDGTPVLVWRRDDFGENDGEMAVAWYDKKYKEWMTFRMYGLHFVPTHWMPLPAAPVESVRAPLTQNEDEHDGR